MVANRIVSTTGVLDGARIGLKPLISKSSNNPTVEETTASGDLDQVDNWTINGMESVNGGNYRVFVEITTSGGNHTVNLYVKNPFSSGGTGMTLFASGTRSGDGTVTLTEQNSSGVSGSVDLTYTGDVALGDASMTVKPDEKKKSFVAGDERWRISEAWQQRGPVPARATLVISNSNGVADEAGNTIAFNPDGPAKDLRIGTRTVIEKGSGTRKVPVFVGSVTHVKHDKDENALVVTFQDDRWLMRNVRVVGRWISLGSTHAADLGIANDPHFQQGWAAHFNPGGRPNCIWYNGKPWFTPYPDYGLADGEAPPDPTTKDEDKASYWTLGSILLYLRTVYGPDAPNEVFNNTDMSKFPWLAVCPKWLDWPESFASMIDADTTANFNSGTGQTHQNKGGARKGREILLEGMGLLDAMHALLDTAGGYTIGLAPKATEGEKGSEFKAEIYPAKTIFQDDNQAAILPIAFSGEIPAQACITGGTFEEDGDDYASSAAGAGQLILTEKRLETDISGGSVEIEPAWTDEDLTKLKQLAAGYSVTVTINGVVHTILPIVAPDSPTDASIQQAFRVFPHVLTTWRIKHDYDFQTGTSESDFPKAPISRPPWPTSLSYMSEAGAHDFAGTRVRLYAEIKNSTGNWVHVTDFNAYEVLENGIIHIPVVRDLGQNNRSWTWTTTALKVTDGKIDITVQDLRTNIAIPADHRAVVYGGNRDDALENADFHYEGNPDADRIEPGLVRRDYKDLRQLYAAWMGKDRYPRPETLGWSQSADRTDWRSGNDTDAIRSDYAMEKQHVKRSLWSDNRLMKGGALRWDGYHVGALRPGDAVQALRPVGGGDDDLDFPVRSTIEKVKFYEDDGGIGTEHHLG